MEEEDKEPVYSIFTAHEKYFIALFVALVGMFSALSSPIYLPVLPTLERKFGVGEKQMNVSVVVYSIFQGLSPSLLSNIADRYGRRVTLLICLVLYIGSDIGLALNNTFAGLLCLRCLQAGGIASTISISSGVVADITVKANRGRYMGMTQGVQLMGQAFGGLLGGVLDTGFGWRGVFWFLAIGAGVAMLSTILFVPETNRAIVGNGSIKPSSYKLVSYSPILFLPRFRRRLVSPDLSTLIPRRNLNMFDSITVLRSPPILLVLVPVSVMAATWIMMLTTLSLSLNKTYGYSTLKVGLCYLPSGVCGCVGSLVAGRLLDWNYKRRLQTHEEKSDGTDVPFDSLRARVETGVIPALFSCGFLLMFGWCIGKHVHIAAVCVSSALCTFFSIMGMGVSMTVLVDLFPNKPSAAAACLNLCRCLLSALGLGVLAYMTDSMGVGACYSLLAGLGAVSCIAYFYIISNSVRLANNVQ